MKRSLRIFALLLALLMVLATFVGCKGDESSDDPSVTTTTAGGGGEGGEDATTTVDRYISKLPDKNFGGEIEYRVYGVDGGNLTQFNSIEIARDTLTGDVIGDAVYTRNEALRQKYGFRVKQDLATSAPTKILSHYTSGVDVYDTVMYHTKNLIQHAQQGYLLDLNVVPHINLEHGSWNQQANTELTIKGKTFLAYNDFLLQARERTFFIMYNRDLFHSYEEYQGVYIEDEYVDKGTWTIAKFYEIASDNFSADLNGGGINEIQDQWAITCDGKNIGQQFAYGGGYRLGRNNDGIIELVPLDERMLDIVSQAFTATLDPNLNLQCVPNLAGSNARTGIDTFTEGRSLFLSDFPSSYDIGLKNIDFEFGILPYPKYDAGQESYYTQFGWQHAATCAIPYMVGNTENAGFFLEAITEASTKTTLEAYYETKCKLHMSYDQRCAYMLDILFGSVVFDIAAILDVGGIETALRVDATGYYPNNVFKRLYEKKLEAATTELEEIMALYN